MKIAQSLESSKSLTRKQQILLSAFLLALLLAVFSSVKLPSGYDWQFFRSGVHRMLSGEPLYLVHAENTEPSNTANFYPPWVFVPLIIPALLPENIGRGIISIADLTMVILIARKFQLSPIKQLAALLSPSILIMLYYGHIDALLLGVFLLPKCWWLISSFTKPQVSIALLTAIPRKDWPKAIAVFCGVFGLSLVFFGLWPLEMVQQPREVMFTTIWGWLWPNQIPIGLLLVFLAQRKNDLRFVMAASPFFMPYISTNSLIGPWITIISLLADWQALLVLFSWWAVVIYQAL